jgi:SAM-dependent methyltransferase
MSGANESLPRPPPRTPGLAQYRMSSTYPPRLALAALLHGGPRGALENVRSPEGRERPRRPGSGGAQVLEIGTGKGENLVALAFYDPDGSYLGLDADPANIDAARSAAGEIGLANVRFEAVDLLEPPLDLGPFDYIFARGVLGVTREPAHIEILRLCRSSLAESGILYMDYPVIPGAANRQLARTLVAPLIDPEGPPAKRVAQAKAAAEAVRSMIAASNHPYPQLLAMELSRLAQSPDNVVWRDYLAGPTTAFLHRDVVALAEAQGLRFVCDAAFNQPEGFVPAEIREELSGRGLAGVDLEQALDILRNRGERGSLFCKAEAPPSEAVGPALLDELGIACGLAPKSESVRLDPGVEEAFEGASGERIASADPLLKAVLLDLRAAWPRPLSFVDLVSAGVERLHRQGAAGEPGDEQLAGLARDLWALYLRGLVELFPNLPRFAQGGGTVLHALARFEARSGAVLTTPVHTPLALTGFDAALVQHMEPGVDEDGLVGAMLVHAANGGVAIEVGGTRLTDAVLLEPMVRGLVRRSVATLARWGLVQARDEDEDEPASATPAA